MSRSPSRRFVVCLVIVLLAQASFLLAQAPQAASVARDWQKYPAIVQATTDADIYAVGDVHGDYGRLVILLSQNGLIAKDPASPDAAQWKGGKATLVCTGDLIDKGSRSLDVIAFFRSLAKSAEQADGRVIVTMGNHEAEFLADPSGKKTSEFVGELNAARLDPSLVAAGGDTRGIGQFLRNLPIATRVNSWFFVHAGNTHGLTLPLLDAAIRAGVDKDGFAAKVLIDPDSILEARLHKPIPWWEQPGDASHPEESEKRLRAMVDALGVKHLVIGHQPGKVVFSDGMQRKKGEMFQKFGGLIYLIDCGMSEAIGDSEGALLYMPHGSKGKTYMLSPNGTRQSLWAKGN